MNDLAVAIIQCTIQSGAAAANRDHCQALLDAANDEIDLIVLPEMFNTGFSPDAYRAAEAMDGPSVDWLLGNATARRAAICGSLAITERGAVYNRFVMACPDGTLHHYDKRHLFSMGGEDGRYTAGNRRRIIPWRGWRLCPMICYDLRFPVWSRNRGDYDALIYVANWPAARRLHWRRLLIARAIENQCPVIGVNRVGCGEHGLDYAGDSLIVDARGELLTDALAQPGVFTGALDARALNEYRRRFPVAADADDFELRY